MAKENRENSRWRPDEESAPMTMSRNGATQEEMAASLGRSVAGIRNRLGEIRSRERQEVAKFLPAVVETEKAETDLSLLLWFVKEAWTEGHAIAIPSLGATFQKEEGA